MRLTKVIFLLVISFFLQCAALEQFLQKPTVRYDKLSVGNLSFTEGTFLFQFQISNPNSIGLSLHKVDYQVELNEQTLFKGEIDQKIQLQASGSSFFEIPVTIRYFDFFKSVHDFIHLDQIPYTLKGSVSIGPFQIPFEESGQFTKPKLPYVSLKSIRLSSLSLTGASLKVDLSLNNPNDFPLQIDGLDYNIQLGDVSIINGSTENLKRIEQNGEYVLRIPVEVGFLELGRSVYNVLRNNSVNYTISGYIKSNVGKESKLSFPFKKSGQVSISR